MIGLRSLLGRVSPLVLTALIVGLPVAVAAAATWAALLAHRRVVEAIAMSARSTDLQRSARDVLSAVTDAETGTRGYLVTENPQFLDAYGASAPRIPALLARLETVAGADERDHATEVRRLAESRMRLMEARLALARAGRFAEARAAVADGEGKRVMDRLRAAVARVDADQSTLQVARSDALRRALRAQSLTLWTMLAVLGLTLLAGVRELLRRLHQHEQIVTMCAWSHTVHDGDAWISIEDYLHRHYGVTISHGISPEQFAIASRAIDAVRKQRQPTA
ncbi:CHASE3 domain-containing protein [Luteitalea sp. TBR-22]|uniref:CHASE3 domain-containing protein n=1 Tax=Luteitalea sp. TBR-22 TaxID=2802971 RepID=UPI001EF4F306|nr:CHASE3 domain-containing protein [Luteitalea sp. TBR-22]